MNRLATGILQNLKCRFKSTSGIETKSVLPFQLGPRGSQESTGFRILGSWLYPYSLSVLQTAVSLAWLKRPLSRAVRWRGELGVRGDPSPQGTTMCGLGHLMSGTVRFTPALRYSKTGGGAVTWATFQNFHGGQTHVFPPSGETANMSVRSAKPGFRR